MLVRLEPDQIVKQWKHLREGVRMGLPPTAVNDDDRMANVLSSLLSGRTQMWGIYQDGKGELAGGVVTVVLVEEITASKTLLIYCFFGYGPIARTSWQDSITTLKTFAESQGCEKMGAFTTHSGISELLKRRVSGVTEQTYIDIPVSA